MLPEDIQLLGTNKDGEHLVFKDAQQSLERVDGLRVQAMKAAKLEITGHAE